MSSISARLYLKKIDVSQLEKPAKHTKSHEYYFNEVGIDYDEERKSFYYSMDLLEDDFPEIFNELVEKVSIRATLILSNTRRSGRYSHLTAEGFVENFNTGGKKVLIMVTGPNFSDANDLFFMMMCGKNFPYEDWEGEQVSGSFKFKGTIESMSRMICSFVETIRNKLIKVRD